MKATDLRLINVTASPCPCCEARPGDEHTGPVCTGSLVTSARSKVEHPAHYGGVDNVYEAIKVIEAWGLGFCLGNTIKYISRAGRKPQEDMITDLKKARWYLDRHIARMEKGE